MKDRIKEILDEDLVEHAESIEEISTGLIHKSFRIDIADSSYIIQLSPLGEEEENSDLSHCLNCYRYFQNSDIPVPEVFTEEIKDYGDFSYIIVREIKGESLKNDLSPENVRTAGKYLAKIHNSKSFETSGWIGFENEGIKEYGFPDSEDLSERILKKLREKKEIYRRERMDSVVDAIEKFVEKRGDDLPREFTPVLLHNDYTPDNLLFKNGELTAVLDWDYVYSGHAQRDLVKAANGFWMHDIGANWDIREALYNGYSEVRELDASFEKNESLYRFDTLVRLVAGIIELKGMDEREKELYGEEIMDVFSKI
ncbi:MAG: aminoglycoside phosphotransferase family protein [Candidatus Nanohaloarchaea archaeon]